MDLIFCKTVRNHRAPLKQNRGTINCSNKVLYFAVSYVSVSNYNYCLYSGGRFETAFAKFEFFNLQI